MTKALRRGIVGKIEGRGKVVRLIFACLPGCLIPLGTGLCAALLKTSVLAAILGGLP
jgi:hypothetical protein